MLNSMRSVIFNAFTKNNPDASLRFLKAIDETIEKLALPPLKGRLRKFQGRDLKNIRSWRVDGFENYLAFYRLSGM